VSSAAGLGDDTLELIDLLLGAAEGTESLLCELTGTLVLGVAEEFDDTALVGSKAVKDNCQQLSRVSYRATTDQSRKHDCGGRIRHDRLAHSE
jgi:hypothetical protein